MALYEKYLRLKIDRSAIGLDNTGERYTYFCTPKGASVIGWAGVEGIHYCFIRGFGEKVFAVSPSNLPGEQVNILADSFEDFLRLLISCGTLDAVEQAHMWNKEQFEEYLQENKPTEEQLQVHEVLQKKFSLVPMEEPFEYIKAIQKSFDYKRLKFEPEYYETLPMELVEVPEWKVYLDSGFWVHHSKGKAGEEISIEKEFQWNNSLWHVPAVYVCKGGLVVDFCIEIETDRIKQFVEKWESVSTEEEQLSPEEREILESENPLNIDFISSVEVNGVQLQRKSGCSMSWIPMSCRPEGTQNEPEWMSIMKHYSLNPDKGWVIHRHTFPWDFKRKPVIKTLQVNMEQHPVPVPGMKFKTPKQGTKFVFTHPKTGIEHIVIIKDIEKQELDAQKWQNDMFEYPTHFTMMSYTLTPELPNREFSISDCRRSDIPKRKQTVNGDSTIGIIGGADGPTAVFLTTKQKDPQLHSACSALHFEPVEDVEWKMVFRIKLCEDITVELI